MFTVIDTETGEQAAEPCRHATTARKRALAAARDAGRSVTVKRGDRAAYTVSPEGHVGQPEGVIVDERERCKRALGTDGPCFCSTCRAERKAARA